MKRDRPLCFSFNLRITKMALSVAAFAMMMLISSAVWAQTMTIKGLVTDKSTGDPLPGVNIKASNGAAAATTVNGTFTIQADAKGTLTFSYLGYDNYVAQLTGQGSVNVSLSINNKTINEVVVIGYAEQKKKDVAGAVSHIDLENSPKENIQYVNALEALQGNPGINIGSPAASGAGVTPSIQIRGQNSINANNSPLIVLDGVIFNGDLNEINFNDIASYDVLQDAGAAAIYGSRSANGVLIITTKRGKTDKPQISLNASYGFQSWTRTPDMRDGAGYIQFREDLAAAKGSASDLKSVFQAQPFVLQAINEGHTTNWLKAVTQNAPIQEYNLSVSGKSGKTNYYTSAGFTSQNGVLANDFYKKPNITIKVESDITDWLTFGVNGYYSERNMDGIAANLYMATYLSPYSYEYLPNGGYQRYPEGVASNYNPFWGNPSNSSLGAIDDNMERYTSIRGIAFLNAKVPFIPGLAYRFSMTGDRQTSDIANFHHETSEENTLLASDVANPTQFLGKAYGSKSQGLTGSYVLDNILTYNRNFGVHHIDALVGYTRDDINTQVLGASGSDFSAFGTTSLGWYGLQYAGTQKTGSTFTETSNVGYVGRINYNFASKYYATVNFRRDANSAFAPGHKYGNFPGGEIAWAATEEDFMKKVSWLNNLKIRASYGKTGNQGISAYSTGTLVGPGNLGLAANQGYTVFGSTSTGYVYPYQLGNTNISWETTTELNIGIDFSILKNRLSGSIDAYSSKTTNELQLLNIPIVTGYSTVQSNLGEVHNKGLNLSLNSVNIRSNNGGFTWTSGFGFWINRNKLIHITGIPNPATGVESDNIANGLFIGKSLGAIYDYTPVGIVQTSDAAYIAANGAVAGDVKFKDINGDGKITTADRSVIGYDNTKPNYSMNLSNTFTYKNFQLFIQVNAVVGGNGYDMATNIRGLDPGSVQIGNWLNLPYWTPTNGENKYPRPNYGNPLSYGFYQNSGYARLQNASLAYLFPKSITDKLKLSSLKLYVSGNNLLTFTGWTGLDPANAGQIGGNTGSTNTSVPNFNPIFRTVSFGLNVGF